MSDQHAAAAAQSTWTMTAEEVRATAIEAYVFGYPLVLMDAARAGAASSGATMATAADRLASTMNRIAHTRRFPDHASRDVAWPDADALCSTAFLDLRQRPLVLSVPEMAGRYYAFQIIDGWSNVFASLGTRTTGGRPRHFALVGPDWLGVLPTSPRTWRRWWAASTPPGPPTTARCTCSRISAGCARWRSGGALMSPATSPTRRRRGPSWSWIRGPPPTASRRSTRADSSTAWRR
jgi:hypothetical protein